MMAATSVTIVTGKQAQHNSQQSCSTLPVFSHPAQRRHIPPSISVSRSPPDAPLLPRAAAATSSPASSPAVIALSDNEPPQSGSRCPTAAADAVFHLTLLGGGRDNRVIVEE